MTVYKVWVTTYSTELNKQVKTVAGIFNKAYNAKLFADAYAKYFSAQPEIETVEVDE